MTFRKNFNIISSQKSRLKLDFHGFKTGCRVCADAFSSCLDCNLAPSKLLKNTQIWKKVSVRRAVTQSLCELHKVTEFMCIENHGSSDRMVAAVITRRSDTTRSGSPSVAENHSMVGGRSSGTFTCTW